VNSHESGLHDEETGVCISNKMLSSSLDKGKVLKMVEVLQQKKSWALLLLLVLLGAGAPIYIKRGE
jgi:hypothetical protein